MTTNLSEYSAKVTQYASQLRHFQKETLDRMAHVEGGTASVIDKIIAMEKAHEVSEKQVADKLRQIDQDIERASQLPRIESIEANLSEFRQLVDRRLDEHKVELDHF